MLTRFAYDSSYYSGNRARPKAFLPPKDKKTSVFRLGDFDHAMKLQHALDHARPVAPKGYAQVLAHRVLAIDGMGLEDETPPPLHVNITGWPDDLEHQKNIAQEIAAEASFIPA